MTHGSLPSQQRSKQPTFTQLECMQFLMHTKTCILHTRCIHAHARSFLLIKNAQSGSFCSFSLFQKNYRVFPLRYATSTASTGTQKLAFRQTMMYRESKKRSKQLAEKRCKGFSANLALKFHKRVRMTSLGVWHEYMDHKRLNHCMLVRSVRCNLQCGNRTAA